jgi:hypothetical protein
VGGLLEPGHIQNLCAMHPGLRFGAAQQPSGGSLNADFLVFL